MKRSIVILSLVLSGFNAVYAQQQDLKRQYKHARMLFDNKEFALAMEAFKPLVVYDKDNPSVEYSSFYYAVSAYELGYKSVAKDMFLQLRDLYPSWDQLPEVNYWLARIYFDQHEYFQGMHILRSITAYALEPDVQMMKRHFLAQIKDTETLRMMSEEFAADTEVARAFASMLALESYRPSSRHTFDSLLNIYHFPVEQFSINTGPVSVKKDRYTISLLFPFMLNTLVPTLNQQFPNQSVLDMYNGMRMAVDSLEKKGIHIDLRSYDTERDLAALKKILSSPELKNSDLIVGPLFNDQMKAVQEFSVENQIAMINPISNSADYFKDNEYAMLYQPSHQTMGGRAAEVMNSAIRKKNVIVYFGDVPKDSVMAYSFMKKAQELGLKIVLSQEHNSVTSPKILTTLATPTDYDDFKNPIQFTLRLDSIGGIYVASDNPLIYSKVSSSLATRGDSIVVIGNEYWIESSTVNFDNMERIHALFAAGNFTSTKNPLFIDFRKKFLTTHGEYPGLYARLGYEFMLWAGNAMKDYGTYFQEGLAERGFYRAWLYEGYDFSSGRDNGYVPFIYFKNGELTVFNRR